MKLEKLPCSLTLDEVRRKGEELALARKKFVETADEAKNVAADFKAKLKELDKAIDELAEQVRSKREMRDVEVIERRDTVNAMVETVRCDTGEVVRSRAMTLNERQVHLFDVNAERDDDEDVSDEAEAS